MAKKNGFVGFLKETGRFFAGVFGLDKWSKSENGQAIQDDINEIGHTLGIKGTIFQTDKTKKEAEKKRQEEVERAQIETAKNMAEINKSLQEIANILGGKGTP